LASALIFPITSSTLISGTQFSFISISLPFQVLPQQIRKYRVISNHHLKGPSYVYPLILIVNRRPEFTAHMKAALPQNYIRGFVRFFLPQTSLGSCPRVQQGSMPLRIPLREHSSHTILTKNEYRPLPHLIKTFTHTWWSRKKSNFNFFLPISSWYYYIAISLFVNFVPFCGFIILQRKRLVHQNASPSWS